MGYASRSGRAIANPESPRAFGVCDRCGIWYNLHALRYEYEWQGTQLINKRFRVCDHCRDVPQPQLKSRILPPDPTPVYDPRVETYAGEFDPTTFPPPTGGTGARPPADPQTPIPGVPGPIIPPVHTSQVMLSEAGRWISTENNQGIMTIE